MSDLKSELEVYQIDISSLESEMAKAAEKAIPHLQSLVAAYLDLWNVITKEFLERFGDFVVYFSSIDEKLLIKERRRRRYERRYRRNRK